MEQAHFGDPMQALPFSLSRIGPANLASESYTRILMTWLRNLMDEQSLTLEYVAASESAKIETVGAPGSERLGNSGIEQPRC